MTPTNFIAYSVFKYKVKALITIFTPKTIVDLKELEKFRFYYSDCLGQYVLNLITKPLTINVWNRKINIDDYDTLTGNILANTLYDLIQAGLVEKVGDIE